MDVLVHTDDKDDHFQTVPRAQAGAGSCISATLQSYKEIGRD